MSRPDRRIVTALAAASLSALLPAAESHAGFTGLTVTSAGTSGGRSVFQVWANFTHAGDVLRQCLNHTVLSGTMSSVMHDDGLGGSWNPSCTSASQSCRDSFVTISGFTGTASSTFLDQGFGGGFGPAIAQGAGWLNPSPNANPIAAGSDLKVMVMQVALAAGSAGYTARMSVGFRSWPYNGAPGVAIGTYTVPSAAGLALVPLLPFVPRRRRASLPLQ